MTRNARALILAAVIPLLALAACAPVPADPAPGITSVTYHQSAAIENFDDADYVQDDLTELQRLEDLLEEYSVTPGVSQTEPDLPCDGSTTTYATMSYTDEQEVFLIVDPCGEGAFMEFNKAADDLFSEWKSAAH